MQVECALSNKVQNLFLCSKENQNLKAEAQKFPVLWKSVPGDAEQIGGDPPARTDPTDHQVSHDQDDGKDSKPQ